MDGPKLALLLLVASCSGTPDPCPPDSGLYEACIGDPCDGGLICGTDGISILDCRSGLREVDRQCQYGQVCIGGDGGAACTQRP